MTNGYSDHENTEFSTNGIVSFISRIKNRVRKLFTFERKVKSKDHMEYFDHAERHTAKLRKKLDKANASIQMPMYLR